MQTQQGRTRPVRRGSVTVKAAWIGVGGILVAAVLSWALGWLRPSSGEQATQQASATDGNAINVSGSNNSVNVGGTTLEVAAVWSDAEQRELQLVLNRIKQAIESHDWPALSAFLPEDRVRSKREIGIDLPQLIEEEVLGLGYEHNSLDDPEENPEGYDRLTQIRTVEFRAIDTTRPAVAGVVGSVTLEDDTRRDVSFELELVNGRFWFVLADG